MKPFRNSLGEIRGFLSRDFGARHTKLTQKTLTSSCFPLYLVQNLMPYPLKEIKSTHLFLQLTFLAMTCGVQRQVRRRQLPRLLCYYSSRGPLDLFSTGEKLGPNIGCSFKTPERALCGRSELVISGHRYSAKIDGGWSQENGRIQEIINAKSFYQCTVCFFFREDILIAIGDEPSCKILNGRDVIDEVGSWCIPYTRGILLLRPVQCRVPSAQCERNDIFNTLECG